MDTKDGKNGRLNDKADWPEKEQRFFNALGPSPEEEAKERRAASEEKSGGVGAGDGAAGDEPRKKEEIKAESAAATAHFCLFRETAPLTKWPDKRNRTRGAIARNARSPWSPAPRVSLERSTTSLPVCRPHAAEGQRERVKRGDSRRYSDGFQREGGQPSLKVASVRRAAEFYYRRRSTFHVHPIVSSILTENR